MVETWEIIKEFPKYKISDHGRVYSDITERILKPKVDKYGYFTLTLSNNGAKKSRTVHRLVAKTFIDNPEDKPEVNHLDGNKLNNHRTNLSWATGSENIIHSYDTGLNNNCSNVTMLDLKANKTTYFRSIKNLASSLGLHSNSIVPYLKRSSTYPFMGRYVFKLIGEYSDSANSTRDGKSVYVYDSETDEITKYASVSETFYHTGIRTGSLNDVLCKIGYVISFSKEKCLSEKGIFKHEDIRELREAYYSVPFSKRDRTYTILDYATSKSYTFTAISEARHWVNLNIPEGTRKITDSNLRNSLDDSFKLKTSGLIRGFGIRSSKYNFPWRSYREEILICSRLGVQYMVKVFELIENGHSEYIFGISNLAKALKVPSDITFREVEKNLDSYITPHVSIRRLNKRIEIKDEDIVSSHVKA